ncbi:MAG: gamma-glutamyltransferase family protein [Limnochordia bacterium]|jgi:gamma-glutamyltranspeptidase/glutathione hydrolase
MQNWSTAYPRLGKEYMVAAEHPLAVQGGLAVLEAGGNAIDAAVAIAAISWVVMPDMCGLGGDIFMIGRQKDGSIWSINGSGVAPQGAEVDYFLNQGYNQMPLDGILSVAVPGALHGLLTAHQRFGSLPLTFLFRDAIEHARTGFPVTPRLYHSILAQREKLAKYDLARALFYPHKRPRHIGELIIQEDLARALEVIASDGLAAFYQGEIAADFLAASQAMGGLFTGEEMPRHTSEFTPPLHLSYRGFDIYQTKPPSQGIIMLEALGILEGFPLGEYGFNQGESIHLMVESLKLAFADRIRWAGDPRCVDFDYEQFLDPDYLEAQRNRIQLDQAQTSYIEPMGGDTTSFVVVDGHGHSLSCIHSLSHPFGSGVIIPNWGILLNNRAGRGFNLLSDHPNCIAPGKRTMHTLNTYLITKDDALWAVGNTPGGDSQPQWNLQVICNLIDFSFNPQQAVAAPRWQQFPGTDPHNWTAPATLYLENTIPTETGEDLKRRGHNIAWRPPGGGAVQLIQRLDNLLLGASDPRSEGLALGR